MTQESKQKKSKSGLTVPSISPDARKLTVLAIAIVTMMLVLSLIVMPFYTAVQRGANGIEHKSEIRAIDIFQNKDSILNGNFTFSGDEFTLESLVVFIAVVVLWAIGVCMIFAAARKYTEEEARYYSAIQKVLLYACLVCGSFYLASVILSTIKNTFFSVYCEGNNGFQFWCCFALAIVFAFLTRLITFAPEKPKPKKVSTGARIEIFIYAIIITTLAILCSLGDILYVHFEVAIDDIYFNGWKALTEYTDIGGSFQLLVFFVLTFVSINIVFFLLSFTSFVGRSRLFYPLVLAQIIGGALSTFLIGLFGKYFAIAEKINEEVLNLWIFSQLEKHGIENLFDPEAIILEYDIQSPSHWFFIGTIGVLCLLLIRKPYTRGTKGEVIVAIATNESTMIPSEDKEKNKGANKEENVHDEPAPAAPEDHDPCPSFTDIDSKFSSASAELKAVHQSAFESLTLPELVSFVVSYARDSRLHLSYTPEDIATFIAGLGTTRLTILQGMSGTGKTSLPKIFAEAVYGTCDIVEVESSWRDKNELLGYYNEFSKVYTPKKFTLALYRARLFPERPTFIVLDEMNLSRIEYYFSDFLSIMEHEEDRREIKLLGTPLYRKHDGKKYRFMGLFEGTTIKIPPNIWFIGTANRDESTFEISDKVYDRAHTMNFNKRAPKVRLSGDPIPQRYVSADELRRLFAEAKASVYFDIESHSVVAEVEKLLAPYNISFGNRIANQIEDFVRIYAACLGGSEKAIADGLERILLSKVVAKLELKSVENKDELAEEFERLGLIRCRDFVMSLNED